MELNPHAAETKALDEALDELEASTPPAPSETKSTLDARQRAWARHQQVADQHARHPDAVHADELRRLDAELETKALSRPPRRPGGDAIKQAVIEIGKEVISIGQKVNAMRTGGVAAARKDRALETYRDMKARQPGGRLGSVVDRMAALERRISIAEVKRDRPPGLAGRYPGASPRSPIGSMLSSPQAILYRKAVSHYLRTGAHDYQGMPIRDLQAAVLGRKAMSTELGPDGGYIVLPEHERSPLMTFLRELSPMRSLATVRQTMTGQLIQPTILSSGEAEWAGERQTVGETDTPTIGEDRFPVFELRANPKITQVLLDDAVIDMESFLTQEVGTRFAERESQAFINGNGLLQPRGLLSYDFVTDHSTWTHGKFRLIETGVSGGFLPLAPTGSPPTAPDNVLLDTIYAVKTANRVGASWLFNRSTSAVVRKFRDVDGRALWQPSTQSGQPDMLLGFPVSEDEYMPDIGADTVAIGFGNWKRTYLIVDRVGVTVLRDPYTVEGHVVFKTRKRVGGGVQYFDAACFVRFST
jgi:HK97 family phage major capsid protein